MKEWRAEETDAGERVDLFLARRAGISRADARRRLESGFALVNGVRARPSQRLRPGDRVEAETPPPSPSALEPEPIALDVLYEDSDLLVINKPRGIIVHPAPGIAGGTVVNAVLAHADDLSGIGGELRPGIVHRLDKDTSGLMVIAKTDSAHISLQKQIQEKSAERRYQAVVWGKLDPPHLLVDAPIGRHRVDRKKMAVHGDAARPAVTELIQREKLGPFALVEARLQTGRTHQIRVHCAYIGHPVVGDPLYGGSRRVPAENISSRKRIQVEEAIARLEGQALHAFHLAFNHPRTGERLLFTAPPPAPIRELLDTLREVYS